RGASAGAGRKPDATGVILLPAIRPGCRIAAFIEFSLDRAGADRRRLLLALNAAPHVRRQLPGLPIALGVGIKRGGTFASEPARRCDLLSGARIDQNFAGTHHDRRMLVAHLLG